MHQQAKQIMAQLKQQNQYLLTTEFVWLEVADAFCEPPLRRLMVEYFNRIRTLERLEIVPVSSALLNEGWALYSKRSDKGWGLTDYISFVVMSREGITRSFTSDCHFEQAGFTKLL
ncbi:type II toxin-antitoxin system VapC family toxin [Phormidesmis priestleyi]|uniref:type II toxin-antitoxin system VapC family toxin n=1 Tax=Phormidesmis priestleyi TaxID=268141 RepID=UPI000AF7EB12|nr:nucleic acid-binding protein [Phormidesmis priestleyi]